MPTGRTSSKLLFIVLPFIFFFAFAPPAFSQEVPPQDVVFLVDSSESMTAYLPAIVGILHRFAGGASEGDSFTCYQFSKNPVMISTGTVRQPSDIKNLQAQLLQLRGTGSGTNFSPALEKGLTEIRKSYRRAHRNDRLLVLITDGRGPENPSTEKITLTSLKTKFSDLEVGLNYHFVCFYMGDIVEADLQSFLNSVGARVVHWPKDKRWLQQATLADVRVVEEEKNIGGVPEIPAHTIFTLSFFPRRPPDRLEMIEMDIEDIVGGKTVDRLFDIRPYRIMCQSKPWSETFHLESRGFARGDYGGRFFFYPSDPQLLMVNPFSIPFRFSVSESLKVFLSQPIHFGPVELEGIYKETRDLYILPMWQEFPDKLEAVRVEADIALPEGLRLNVLPVHQPREIVVYLTLSREEDAPPLTEGEYEGKIRFSSPTGWTFDRRELPIMVSVREKPLNLKLIAFYVAGGAGALILAAVAVLSLSGVRQSAYDYLTKKADPAGKLILLKDPTRGLATDINISRAAKKSKIKSVVIGTGEGIDVEISHISLVDKRYILTGTRSDDVVQTFLQASPPGTQVIINEMALSGRVPLNHLDRVKIGAFEFRYEQPMPLRQVVLHYLSGEVKQGWLLDWDITAEGFSFLLRERAAQPIKSYARFHELKAVTFVRDFDGDVSRNLLSLKPPRTGHLAQIVFADDEELTGYVFEWKQPADKFYIFPKSKGENILFLLVERHTLKGFRLLKENRSGARRAKKHFTQLMKTLTEKFGTKENVT
ncbi:MAG: VWA domain-containing protein [Candidatus Abyssobacteria bacterium SURF_5]|uniref:VWA domain-containing protein n=1 Tax=Abyssobacteria bacterium (strain SURF_5) TaxID=2093360 RepID=A0A3A4N8E9_ABYX5|nr:MAG: VWA domain-containing protein [Candidatus Abyssubacteria bacterium SURF_5]